METHPKLHEISLELPAVHNLRRYHLSWRKLLLALADLCSMPLSILFADLIYGLVNPNWTDTSYLFMEPSLIVFGSSYILIGHYQSRNVNQVEELRQLTTRTTIFFLTILSFYTLVGRSKYPGAIFGISWITAIGFVPLARFVVRWLGSRLGFLAEPVVVIGNGELSRKIVHFLLNNTYCGIKPVLVVDGFGHASQNLATRDVHIPVVSFESWQSTTNIRPQMSISTAIVVATDLPSHISESIAGGEHLGFSNIITISKQFNTRNFGLEPLDFGGILGFEERHYELDIFEDQLIRLFDVFLIFVSLPLLIPFLIFTIIAIRLDSTGSVFYRQRRIGKGGGEFKVLKFRTMVKDADQVLVKYLEENPELLAEWKADHKLKKDPRITRIGKILRKTSIDELPQIWNVLKGEMSLVGPRPIVSAEIERYADRYKYYTQVPPGISGLWQVSGRNDVDYEERVSLDEYYVRNRSIWLNLYIIIRTIQVVIRRHGAY